jgi:DNA-binding transcriptional LysR family regulator
MRSDLIDRRIKLHHLKIVIAVAQWRSMAKAAKHLAISQPVVSKAVADLEFVLGVSLFDRSPHGVEPTAYGRALLRRGIAIFDDLQTGVDEIRFMADPTTGELRIGTTEPLLAGLGLRVMEQLWGKHPKINFHFVEADSSTLLNREVPERRVELALVPLLSASLHAELDATILFHDHLRVVVGAKSPWAQRREVTLAELTGESWCLAPSPIGSLVAGAFPASGLPKPRVAVTATTTHLLFQLLESGRFIGHFGDSLLQFHEKRFALKMLPIDLPAAPFAIAVVTLKNRTISPVAQLFIDCAREVTKSLPRSTGPISQRPTKPSSIARRKALPSISIASP